MKIRSKSKTRRVLLLFGLGMMAAGMNAQYLKSGQIEVGNTGAKFRISDWNTEGGVGKYTDDDNFFISRVKPRARFYNPATQVNRGGRLRSPAAQQLRSMAWATAKSCLCGRQSAQETV